MCQCHRIVIEKYLRVSIFERDKRDIRVQGTEQISECYLLPVASNLLTAAIQPINCSHPGETQAAREGLLSEVKS